MNQVVPDLSPAQPHEKTSKLLARIVAGLSSEKVAVGILLYRLRRRSFGGVLFFLALLSLIPGIAIVAGLVIIVLGTQLALGFKTPKFIGRVNELKLDVTKLTKVVNKTIPTIRKLEAFVRPRWAFMTTAPMTFVLGLFIVVQALILLVPLPFTGLLPVLSMLAFALGFLERDGVMALLGIVLSIASTALGYWIITLALNSVG